MPNLFPQLLAAVFSCIFHGVFSFPFLQLSIIGLSLPSQAPVSPGLLQHEMCSRNIRFVPSPVISHSPSKGAAAPLGLPGGHMWAKHLLDIYLGFSELEKHPQLKDFSSSPCLLSLLCKRIVEFLLIQEKKHTQHQYLLGILRHLLLLSPVRVPGIG